MDTILLWRETFLQEPRLCKNCLYKLLFCLEILSKIVDTLSHISEIPIILLVPFTWTIYSCYGRNTKEIESIPRLLRAEEVYNSRQRMILFREWAFSRKVSRIYISWDQIFALIYTLCSVWWWLVNGPSACLRPSPIVKLESGLNIAHSFQIDSSIQLHFLNLNHYCFDFAIFELSSKTW